MFKFVYVISQRFLVYGGCNEKKITGLVCYYTGME